MNSDTEVSVIDNFLMHAPKGSLQQFLKPFSGFEIAEFISKKSEEEQLAILTALAPEASASALDYLSPRKQRKILLQLPQDARVGILQAMAPDDLTALFQKLPRAMCDEYVALLPEEERTNAFRLLSYPKGSIGRLMTTDYIAVKLHWTIAQVLERIRQYGYHSQTVDMIYVVDDSNKLIDDIKTTEFLFAGTEDQVKKLITGKFTYLSVYDKAEKEIDIFKQNDCVALPVLSPEGLMLGVVAIDDVLHLSSKRTTENMQKIAAIEVLDEAYTETPFSELVKKRARWLVVLFIGEMLTATAMSFFEAEISKAVVLALFLPLIISSGGNAGSQSSTLIIRAMALGEVKLKDWFHVMKREIATGAILGAILGIVGFFRVALWNAFGDIYGAHWVLVGTTVSFALVGVVLWGSLAGSMLPLVLKRFGADPATSSAPLVATLVDVTGIVIYFTIAMQLLHGVLL